MSICCLRETRRDDARHHVMSAGAQSDHKAWEIARFPLRICGLQR